MRGTHQTIPPATKDLRIAAAANKVHENHTMQIVANTGNYLLQYQNNCQLDSLGVVIATDFPQPLVSDVGVILMTRVAIDCFKTRHCFQSCFNALSCFSGTRVSHLITH